MEDILVQCSLKESESTEVENDTVVDKTYYRTSEMDIKTIRNEGYSLKH